MKLSFLRPSSRRVCFRFFFCITLMTTALPTAEILDDEILEGVADAGEIQFVEDFVLAKDRNKAIELLIPGTEEHYFYQCLHLQNTRQFAAVEKLLKQWEQRIGRRGRFEEIRHRQMLLTYSDNPKRTLTYLTDEIHPNLNHQRDQLESKPKLPSQLDPKLVSYETLLKRALRTRGLRKVTDIGLRSLETSLDDATRRREYLSRVQRPTHPELVELIIQDLKAKGSRGFGSLNIHRKLLLEQLDELITRRPQIENQTNFVNAYVQKLQPNPDVDWQNDRQEQAAYYERMYNFVANLNASHNSLKAHVLFHWLELEEKQGRYNKKRFLEYLALPRHTHYIQPRLMESNDARRYPVDLGFNPGNVTRCPPIQNDEPLVRRFLLHFFQTEGTIARYEPFIKDDYLKRVFAEAKITAGVGDAEKWFAMLPPAEYQSLKDRVDLDFALTNPQHFKSTDAVELDVDVKNVDKLIVKVYEVNTRNYYQKYGREVNTDIKLDGLIPNHEVTYEYDEAPVIRKRRNFKFPNLDKPGVYVIDFIGNGKSSRAVIRKGELHYLVETTAAGHIFTAFDDQNRQVKDFSIWMSGQNFTTEADGTPEGSIVVPFSTNPGRQPVVISAGILSSLHYFKHQGEKYDFNIAAYIDRESLLDRQEAMLLLRPQVRLSGVPVSPTILENVKVTIQSTTIDGTNAERVYEDVKLAAERDTPLVFLAPNRLSAINVNVTATIKNAKGAEQNYVATQDLQVNGIDRTDKIEDVHLTKMGDEYIVQLLGKTGEARPFRAVRIELLHKMFTDEVRTNLATDQNGVIRLGRLDGITRVEVKGPTSAPKTWFLRHDRRTARRSIHALAGETIEVPHMFSRAELEELGVTLYELRGGTFARDASKSVSIGDHFVELKKLQPGDYSLSFDGQETRIRVTAGEEEAGYAFGKYRRLERPKLKPIQLTSVTSDGTNLNIQVANASKYTRVHVYATRFYPAFDSYAELGQIQGIEPLVMRSPSQRSLYMAGRKLGEELQYVLERGYATKYPGNLLERPTLILNSWPVRTTETTTRTAAKGEEFDAANDAPAASMMRQAQQKRGVNGLGDFANLDFLAEPSMSLVNRTPDKSGRISIPLKELGGHHHFQVVAVDPLATVYRSLALDEFDVEKRDLRLLAGLDPEKHYTQQKKITLLAKDEKFEMSDITTGRFDTYDNLSNVYSLYATLSGNDVLQKFRFVLEWPNLRTEEKKEKYSEFSCHELNFFIYKKDREFFDEVVRPYIANKQHKTFLDLWLLEVDLTEFLKPWEYGRLNTAERLLLAERIDGEDARARRYVEDLFGLKPFDVSRWNVEFQSAILGKSLRNEDRFGFMEKQRAQLAAVNELSDYAVPPAAAASPAEMGADARGGMGGGMMGGMGGGGYGGMDGGGYGGMDGGGYGGRARYSREDAPERASGVVLKSMTADESKLNESLRSKKARGRSQAFAKDKQDFDMEMKELGEAFDDDGVEGIYATREFGRRRKRQLYEKLEKTQEWAENNYYRLPIEQHNAELVEINAFWNDYATREKGKAFFSPSWTTATRNFTEMMYAMSLLDLPFEGGEHESKFEEGRMTLTAASPMILFQEQIREAKASDEESPILITQNFFKADDRYQMVQGVRRDKFVTEEFLTHVVYGCQVVLTNPTSSPRKVQLLLQIPHASIPVNGVKPTQTIDYELAPYHTQTVDYFFYFPATGNFKHFPAHVAQDETVLASADAKMFKVLEKPSKVDTESWDYVSQFASNDEVLEYLDANNVHDLDLARMAHRMGNKQFFAKAIALLEGRHAYDDVLWAYGVKHNDQDVVATWLKHSNFLYECGQTLSSPLVNIDPIARFTYQHLDYKPLVNARAHQLGARRRILNNRFDEQYHRMLHVLKYRDELTSEDRMALVYYLLLQDRIEEAIEMFDTVQRSNLATMVQYDYFAAYLDCFNEEPTQARGIVTQYLDYPVPKWQKAFANVKAMLDEVEGQDALVVDEKDRTQKQVAAAAEQSNFDFVVEDKEIKIDYQNVDQVEVNYYLIDLELLFSSNPFVNQLSGSAGQFSHIQPNASKQISLAANDSKKSIDLPEEYHNRNLLIEVVADGITRSQPYFSNSLTVQMSENYGQLKVTDTKSGKALPKTYVKCYAKMKDGRTLFYKDGYTDLRGRFDYSSLSTNELDFVNRFSLLILDDERGGLVREAQVPKR